MTSDYFAIINKLNEEKKVLCDELTDLRKENEQLKEANDQLLHEILEMRNSKTYKLSKKITFLPRILNSVRIKNTVSYKNKKRYPYMISVVIAVYNTKDYIGIMIDSLLNQKKDILSTYLKSNPDSVYRSDIYSDYFEIILVDDGSTDGSDIVCDNYANRYPFIKTVHKQNEGVSKARNAGIDLAQGKYITFPDSDDILSDDVFEKCFVFFESHEDEISLVTYPLKFFDAQTGDHWTTYRFGKGTRVLDMLSEWDKPQFFTAASFFKTADLQGKIYFNPKLINGEDIMLAHELIFSTTTNIGLVADCTYWYRRRSEGELSAIQQSKKTTQYYISYVQDLLNVLLDKARQQYGEIPKFVQSAVMGQLQWRLLSDKEGEEARSVLGEEGFQQYRNLIKKVVHRIDLDVILSQRMIFREQKYYLCSIKTDGKVERIFGDNNIRYYFDNHYCSDAASCYCRLEFLSIKDGFLRIEGSIANLEPGSQNWIINTTSQKKYYLYQNSRRNTDVKTLDEIILFTSDFSVNIPLSEIGFKDDFLFGSSFGSYEVIKTNLTFGKFMPISKMYEKSYYYCDDRVIKCSKNCLTVQKIKSQERDYFESDFTEEIVKKAGNDTSNVIELLNLRKQALELKKNKKKPIWLVSDRYSHADDNGEAFFLFLINQNTLPADVYFIIDLESPDYNRLSRYGNVVAQDSEEHLRLHLAADCIISSQADEYIIDPFWRNRSYSFIFKDFYSATKFVFLQHGVIKDDLSRWLNRYNKDINGFICSAIPEAKSVMEYDYYYDKENVWLTGLPRFDRLYHNEKKKILVMPTWRKWLMKDFNAAESDKDATHVQEGINNTEFFKFYYSLLNDQKLLSKCEEYGYTLCFMPHTNLREVAQEFCTDSRISVLSFDMPYRDAFAEAELIITDYSSTAMDFAYLEKPVIYTQFDNDRFFSGVHTYDKGYFEYEKNGFGPVTYDLESLIDTIITYIENSCKLQPEYQNRIHSFFAYMDQNNCKRVYEKIIGL